MNTLSAAALCSLAFVSQLAAQEEARKKISMADALKLGVEKIADSIKGGEAGEDEAAQLYATARRLDTESKLAQKDLGAVLELDYWRHTLSECIDGFCGMAYAINGGGTMYSHAMSRNDAGLEDFLAKFAKEIPLPEGKGDKAAEKDLEKLIAFTAKLEIDKDTAEGMEKEALQAFKDDRTKLVSAMENLKAICSGAPAASAKSAIAFVVRSASWLEYPGAEEAADAGGGKKGKKE